MSEENKLPKRARVDPRDELNIYLLYKQGKSLEEIQEKARNIFGEKWSMHTLTKMRSKFKKGYVPKADADTMMNLGVVLGDDLSKFDAEKSMSRSFKMATRLLEKALEDAQKGYEIIDESNRKIPIKTIMECIEKAGRYWALQRKTQKEAGRSGGPVSVDYEKMAELYIKYKNDPKVEYDAQAHMKAVIEQINSDTKASQEIDKLTEEFEDEPVNEVEAAVLKEGTNKDD